MSWGLFILILVIFIAFTFLVFIQFNTTPYFAETYFIVVILALFIILLFTIDFDNPVSTTLYINTEKDQSPIIYTVPYNSDSEYSNLMSASFAGTYSSATDPTNSDPASNTVVFNYNTIESAVNLLNGKIVIEKVAGNQLSITIKPTEGTAHKMDGFLTLNLLCTGSQSINGKFEQI
jgi:hypothetical protein